MDYRTNVYKSEKEEKKDSFKEFLSYVSEYYLIPFFGFVILICFTLLVAFGPAFLVGTICWACHNFILVKVFSSSVTPISYWSCIFIAFLCRIFFGGNDDDSKKS